MRSNEERVAAVKQRVAQIERQKRQRKKRIAALSAAAVCLIIIIGLSFAMPGLSEKLITWDNTGYETAASIFSGSAVAGYIIIGILVFALGVCVTVLCFRLKVFQKKDEETGDGNGGVH